VAEKHISNLYTASTSGSSVYIRHLLGLPSMTLTVTDKATGEICASV